jgi:hypothetical protein
MYASSSIALADGYLIAGTATPLGGSHSGLILETDLQGNLVWNRTYTYLGHTSNINSISLASDGFMFLGTAQSNPEGAASYTWISKIDDSGQVQEQLAVPMGNHESSPSALIQTVDGGYVFVGVWNQTTTGSLNQRFWIAKVSEIQSNRQPNTPSWLLLTIVAVAVASAVTATLIARKRSKHLSVEIL